MMNEQEFEEFKNNIRDARKNRLYVSFRNSEGMDCRTIGPSSQCFCGHRYKDHFFDNINERKINCRTPKCKCKMFDYVPIFGSQDLKCLCKHSYKDHDPVNKRCLNPKCKHNCMKFTSKHGCSCPLVYDDHVTVFESREEREAEGRPVDPKWMQEQNMIAGMGGLSQGFMDLVDGQDRAQMMNPQAIMSNLEGGNMLMAPQMRAAIGAPPQQQPQPQMRQPAIGYQQQPPSGGGLGMMASGSSLKNIGQQIIGGTPPQSQSRVSQGQPAAQQQLMPMGGGGVNAYSLFCTPHKFGGTARSGASSSGVDTQIVQKQLAHLRIRK